MTERAKGTKALDAWAQEAVSMAFASLNQSQEEIKMTKSSINATTALQIGRVEHTRGLIMIDILIDGKEAGYMSVREDNADHGRLTPSPGLLDSLSNIIKDLARLNTAS